MNNEDKVIQLISQITEISASDLKVSRAEMKIWNSLQHVEVIFALEEEFSLVFSVEELAKMTSVSAIVSVLDARNE